MTSTALVDTDTLYKGAVFGLPPNVLSETEPQISPIHERPTSRGKSLSQSHDTDSQIHYPIQWGHWDVHVRSLANPCRRDLPLDYSWNYLVSDESGRFLGQS